MKRYCVLMFIVMVAQLKALTLQQIMENPQPGEYLTDQPVELFREKVPQQKTDNKYGTKKLLINLIRVDQLGKVSLDYYNSKLPRQKAVVMIEKLPPIQNDLILPLDTDLEKMFGQEYQIHGECMEAVTVWRFFNISKKSLNVMHIDARFVQRKFYISMMKFSANISSFKGFKKQDKALENFRPPSSCQHPIPN